MGEEEYETLPTHSVGVHLVAGALAGAIEHCVMFPFDSVKTRMQSLCPCPETKCPTPVHSLWNIVRREGWLRPLRGVNAVAAGSMPAHALYFTVYEKSKGFLTGNTAGHSNTLAYGASGVVATLVHDAVMNPAEVVKQRMQMQFSPYGSSLECVRCIYQREGMMAFYRSYTTQLVMAVPFQSIHFMTYEFWQHIFNPEHKYDPRSHLVAGGMAGGLAAAITTPLDCIKTVLNTQQTPDVCQKGSILVKTNVGYRGIMDAVRIIYQQRGLGGFTFGAQARVVFQELELAELCAIDVVSFEAATISSRSVVLIVTVAGDFDFACTTQQTGSCHTGKCILYTAGFVLGGAAIGYFIGYKIAMRKIRINTKVQLANDKVVDSVDLEDIGEKKAFCRCWKSDKFPYCDGAHTRHNNETGDNIGPLIVKGSLKH